MANKNSKGMWIAGAILGSIAGAAYALWKTPMSGQELRSKLATGPVNQNDDVVSDQPHTQGVGGKILSKVEHTLAPIVGVELGKTATGPVSGTATPVAATEETKAEPSVQPVASAPQKTASSGSESIRAHRFAWGEPAPEPAAPVAEEKIPAAVIATPIVDAAETPAANTSGYGTESIRSKRFAWGEPAPESTADSHGNSPQEQATTPIAVAVPEPPVAAASGTNMRQFPKLGGLED